MPNELDLTFTDYLGQAIAFWVFLLGSFVLSYLVGKVEEALKERARRKHIKSLVWRRK